MRTLAVVSLVALWCGATAHAQSPLVKILSDELERNFNTLKQKADPAPYFLGFEVTDQEQDVILASRGSIDGQNHEHNRILDTTVRVGTPKSDNYRRVGNDRVRFTLPTRIALDDNADSIRKTVWLTTDRVYRGAAQRLIRIQSDEKLRAAAADGSDDFSVEQPQTSFSSPPALKFNSAEWAARLRKVSAEMSKYPGAINSDVAVIWSYLGRVSSDLRELDHVVALGQVDAPVPAPHAVAPVAPRDPRAEAPPRTGVARTCSTSEFHSPHPGQRPAQRADSWPHPEQT